MFLAFGRSHTASTLHASVPFRQLSAYSSGRGLYAAGATLPSDLRSLCGRSHTSLWHPFLQPHLNR